MQNAVWDRIEVLSGDLKVKPVTFRVWKSRGFVPGKYHMALLIKGQGTKNAVKPSELEALSKATAKRRRHG